jgi:hypothetical protein
MIIHFPNVKGKYWYMFLISASAAFPAVYIITESEMAIVPFCH